MIELFIGSLVVLVALWRYYGFKRAVEAPVRDDVCVACDSSDLLIIGRRVYRCKSCGYEGGSGVQAMREAAQAKKLATMAPEARRASGLKDLREARTLLLGCQGIMTYVLGLSRTDMIGGSEFGRDKQHELANAVREMTIADQLIKDARKKLDDGLPEALQEGLEVDFGSAAFFLDIVGDNIVSDMMVHSKIKKASAHCQAMLSGVEGALKRLEAAGS